MGRKVMLVRGGILGPNTGIGGAHATLVHTLKGGAVSGWSLHGVQEYDLGPRPNIFRRALRRWLTHPRAISSLAKKSAGFDLIHITDQEQAHLVPKHSGVPVVVTVHDLFHLFPSVRTYGNTTVSIGATSPSRMRRRDLAKLQRGLARADLLLCDSKSTMQACQIHFPNVESVWVPLGLEMARFAPSPDHQSIADQPAKSLSKACHLLIVGSHDPRKRMDFLLQVLGGIDATILQEIHIHHVGNTASTIGAPSTVELAAQHNLPNFTAHGGDLSDKALMDMRFASEALLFPSISEGFGYPPIESMATGTPVLCADEASHNELMPDGVCLPPNDVEAWQNAIVEVHASWRKRTASNEVHEWPAPETSLIEHAHSFSLEAYNHRTSEAYNRLF
jgi:glycosyltransferase involved in cell wall biosynthesis